MIYCIIVDDEPLAQNVIEAHISKYPGLQLVKKCSNAAAAFDVLHTQKIDLMFLDIKMPGINGVDFLRALSQHPKVIFTTAYSEYAATAFDLEAVDYLLKPVTFDRFKKSMDKLLNVRLPAEQKEVSHTYFKVSGKLIRIDHLDLIHATAVKDYILLKTSHGSYLTHMTMKSLELLLPESAFIRIHRSYLVNKAFIRQIDKSNVVVGADTLPLGKLYSSNILKVT